MQTPFIGPSYNLESRPASVQRTINLVPVPLEPGNERAPWVLKDVPGLVAVPLVDSAGIDPFFDDVLLLLHGNGVNNGSVFTDSSSYARTMTRIDSRTFTSTADSKFNGSSIRSSGTGSGFLTLSMPEASGRNWCMETWVKRDATFDFFGLFSFATGNVLTLIDGAGSSGTYRVETSLSGITVLNSPTAITSAAFEHVALTCEQASGSNNTLRLFVGGVLVDSFTSSDPNLTLSGMSLQLGRATPPPGSAYGINGYFAEYRITNATRYTASFIPPTTPFPDA